MSDNSAKTPFQISDDYTDAFCDLAPLWATYMGVSGHDDQWSDLSPDGVHAIIDLTRSTRDALRPHLEHPDPVQSQAAKVMTGRFDTDIASYERGKWKRNLNHTASPFQAMTGVFDLMPKTSAEGWGNVVSRLSSFDEVLAGYRSSLELGISEANTVSRRQVLSVIDQARETSGDSGRFSSYADDAQSTGGDAEAVAAAVGAARKAIAEFGDWLESDYLPVAREEDAVGRDEYLIQLDEFLGMDLDLDETYEWGWSEVHRLMDEMRATAKQIDSEMSVSEVIEMLDTDESRSAPSHEAFAEFVQGIQNQAIAQLDGAHFDVPDEIKTVTVNIAPPGGPLGAWYNPPSEDFSRPGSIWYACGERERIPYWQEVATAYHEGFPGHHLQVGIAALKKEQMSRFHRLGIWYSGSGEGWALYAEQLMDELGYFEKPEYRLGLLASQLFRATRIVVDIGSQLRLPIPDHAPLNPGDDWSFDIAVDYMDRIGLQAPDIAESEVKRYLGWWGQAISYKVGEREILAIRSDVMKRDGSAFDRKDFHRRVLEAGAIRLDHLREALL